MKAKSRGSKLRLKRGRKPNPEAVRTPCGRATRAGQGEAMKQTVIEARQRVFGMSEDEAKDQEAGSVLGRLYLDGSLGPVHKKHGTSWVRLKAGERYAEEMTRYYNIAGIRHPNGKAQDLFSVHGYDSEITNCGAGKDDPLCGRCQNCAVRKAARQMMKLVGCLGAVDVAGRHVSISVYSVCVREIETARGWHVTQLRHLVRGLDALVELYGLKP